MTTIPTPTAVILPDDSPGSLPGYVLVRAQWLNAGTDRTDGYGWVTKPKNAPRLVRAIESGAVFYDARIATDVNGRTYVDARSRVMGRYMNADLKRLGY